MKIRVSIKSGRRRNDTHLTKNDPPERKDKMTSCPYSRNTPWSQTRSGKSRVQSREMNPPAQRQAVGGPSTSRPRSSRRSRFRPTDPRELRRVGWVIGCAGRVGLLRLRLVFRWMNLGLWGWGGGTERGLSPSNDQVSIRMLEEGGVWGLHIPWQVIGDFKAMLLQVSSLRCESSRYDIDRIGPGYRKPRRMRSFQITDYN